MRNVILILSLLLAACGGGEDATAPAVAQPEGPPMTKIVKIGMYGDSTTAGYDGAQVGVLDPTIAEPTVLQSLLRNLFPVPAYDITVTNYGVSGTSAWNLLYGDANANPPVPTFEQRMAASTDKIITINFGMNDSVPAAGVTLDMYRQHIGALVDIARAHGKIVVLQQPNPSCTPDHINLRAYVRALDQVGRDKGVPVVDQYWRILELVPDQQGMNPGAYGTDLCYDMHKYFPDGIHPNAAMYSFKASNTLQFLAPIVAGM